MLGVAGPLMHGPWPFKRWLRGLVRFDEAETAIHCGAAADLGTKELHYGEA